MCEKKVSICALRSKNKVKYMRYSVIFHRHTSLKGMGEGGWDGGFPILLGFAPVTGFLHPAPLFLSKYFD